MRRTVEKLVFQAGRGLRLMDAVEIFAANPYTRSPLRFMLANGILRPFQRKSLIFVHVPKNAGTSVAHSLFGEGLAHYSAQLYRDLDPDFYEKTLSFAILRDPVERFISSYFFVNNKGGDIIKLNPFWRRIYGEVPVDLDGFIARHYELAAEYRKLDYVLRPQVDFVTDRGGTVMVDRLFVLGEDDAELADFLAGFGLANLPRLNVTSRRQIEVTPAQRDLIEGFYKEDLALIRTVRHRQR